MVAATITAAEAAVGMGMGMGMGEERRASDTTSMTMMRNLRKTTVDTAV